MAEASTHSCKKPDTTAAAIKTQMIKSSNCPKKMLNAEYFFASFSWFGPYLFNLVDASCEDRPEDKSPPEILLHLQHLNATTVSSMSLLLTSRPQKPLSYFV